MSSIILEGYDNYKRPRQQFADKLATLDNNAFIEEASRCIWLSAYANNNPRSDYHWQADACYKDAQRRGKPELYSLAHKQASNQ